MGQTPGKQGNLSNRSMPPGTIIPELGYPNVDEAAEWLCNVFGFRKRLRIGDHRFQLKFAGTSVVATKLPTSAGGAPANNTHGLLVHVADVDGHYEQARRLGARILSAPETFPFGERQYSVEDPGGHRWTFTQSVADVDPAEWGGQAFDLS